MKSDRGKNEIRVVCGELQHASIRGGRGSWRDQCLEPRVTCALDHACHVSILVCVEMDVTIDHKAGRHEIAPAATFDITQARARRI
jgi:hypothetical protein